MKTLIQSPTDPAFVQDPYSFYAEARKHGQLHHWQDYGMVAAFGHSAVHMLLRDRRFGREVPEELRKPGPAHLAPFLAVEAHSMLDAEPPRHTRLRRLVLHAFTSRGIAALEPGIRELCHQLAGSFPDQPFDLLDAYCTQVPVITICRLLGVPEEMAPQLLDWSHKMVAMYQASRTEETEHAAAKASQEFTDFLRGYIAERRNAPRDDLITRLIAAEEEGDKLSTDELIGTCILLLNAGHEATVHSLGNGVKTMLQQGWQPEWLAPEGIEGLVEEILRFDPPLHMFTRYAYEEAEVFGHTFQRGDQVALLLGAANRDASALDDPHRFDPSRPPKVNKSFGGGLHFCVGAPLARLEMQIALPILFEHCPDLKLAAEPEYSNTYHFHGLTRLMVTRS
ncbi:MULTISPECIES: cytochrome P450 [unclassified Leisingera]|uniref:cytochrome P450 n=1 Tax=unclassified Leisingera TaxID=2614906 RepID=UPI00031B7C32|nr:MULTISPECIES: cytochrome P450 [unclassified Leisingera]KIC26414.1 cytochrome P450 [Leisingera sp. ANG-S3]KIC52733.1 cytochrome P450 [Leisingera sp. ANG-S]KID09586.1 cytochrome P450 [Leisingera sp. ANG1]